MRLEAENKEDLQELQEKKMGVAPINKLLISMALPMMISMLVQALYNIVDSVFVAKLGQDAFNAVSFAFPIQNVMIAIASGTGVGVNALIARSLGAKNKEQADGFAMHGLFLALCSTLLIMIFGVCFSELFFRSQTSNENIIRMGKEYLLVCCGISFGLMGQIIFERLLQSTGKTGLSMVTQGVGAIINIILDPILIFGWFGLPALGVTGAALATVIGQIISFVTGWYLNRKYNVELTLKIKGFKPDKTMIGEIYKIGFPSILMMSIGSIMTYMMNRLLIDIEKTETAAAVFGAYFKLQSFVIMPVIGLGNAVTPIVGYNLGAKRKARMKKTYYCAIFYALCIMLVGTLLMFFIPRTLLSMFEASEEMLVIGEKALKIISPTFLIAAYGITTSNFFQACGKSVYSLLMSLCRQLVVLLPLAYLFGYTIGYEAVWYAIPLAELGSLAVAFFGKRALKKNVLSALPD